MNIALVARCDKTSWRRGGGIAQTGLLYRTAWDTLPGSTMQFLSHKRIPNSIDPDTDLVWLYADWDVAPRCVELARSVGAPCLVLANFNTSSSRNQNIANLYEELDPTHRGDVFFQVFTHQAEATFQPFSFANQLVAVPQPFRVGTPEMNKPFEQREGICLGDTAKMSNPRFTEKWHLKKTINALTDTGVPCWAYQQYRASKPLPENLHIQPYQRDFLPWLGSLRLMVSLVTQETMAMVPLEAMTVGTPALYRHMPQSHSQYIGFAGLRFREIDELVEYVKMLYFDPVLWQHYSEMGVSQTEPAHLHHLAATVQMALQGMLGRFRRSR